MPIKRQEDIFVPERCVGFDRKIERGGHTRQGGLMAQNRRPSSDIPCCTQSSAYERGYPGVMHRVGAFALSPRADLVESDGYEHAAPMRLDDRADDARLGEIVRLHQQLALPFRNPGDQQRGAVNADRRLVAGGDADRGVAGCKEGRQFGRARRLRSKANQDGSDHLLHAGMSSVGTDESKGWRETAELDIYCITNVLVADTALPS